MRKIVVSSMTATVFAALGIVSATVVVTPVAAQTAQAVANTRIAAMRAIINANRNNPAELRTALAAYLVNNPDAAPLVSNSIAGQGLPAAALAAVGQALADARASLAAAGNSAAANAVAAEAATLPPAAQGAYTNATTSGTTNIISTGASQLTKGNTSGSGASTSGGGGSTR